MTKVKEYSNGEVTVVWKPELCSHTGICSKGLPEVFKPKEKPWIKVDKASTEAIVKQVKQCPSGALTHYMNKDEENNSMESASEDRIKVEVRERGPLVVHGKLSITHSDGSKENKSRVTTFCRCGTSSNQPFCDGSHKDVDYEK